MPDISSSSLALTKMASFGATRFRNSFCRFLSVRPSSSTLNIYITGFSVRYGMNSSEGSFLRLASILALVSSSASCSSRLMMSISSFACATISVTSFWSARRMSSFLKARTTWQIA